MTSEKSHAGWYFLLGVVCLYMVTFLASTPSMLSALQASVGLFVRIVPILSAVFILMALVNYFVKPKTLTIFMGKGSGAKGWAISIIAGILSTGPIYLWYPLLNELQKQGVRNGLIAAFLYNRAVKIPLFPMLIMYFGITYAVVLTVVMVVASVFQGIVTEKLSEVKK